MYNVKITIEMFQPQIYIINLASVEVELIHVSKQRRTMKSYLRLGGIELGRVRTVDVKQTEGLTVSPLVRDPLQLPHSEGNPVLNP